MLLNVMIFIKVKPIVILLWNIVMEEHYKIKLNKLITKIIIIIIIVIRR